MCGVYEMECRVICRVNEDYKVLETFASCMDIAITRDR